MLSLAIRATIFKMSPILFSFLLSHLSNTKSVYFETEKTIQSLKKLNLQLSEHGD